MRLPLWAFWVALAAMVIGLFGVFVPFLPDIVFIWLVILLYAIAEGFATIGPFTLMVLTVLGALGFSAEYWMSHAGARAGGASGWSLLVGALSGALGFAVGLIFSGLGAIPGAVVGTLAGLVGSEWYRRRDWPMAIRVAGGWLVGYLLSIGVELFIGLSMILIFVWQALIG